MLLSPEALFFVSAVHFRIIDDTSFIAKDGDDTSIQLPSKN
jgi:hypothetical protein